MNMPEHASDILYFGQWTHPGHFLWMRKRRYADRKIRQILPWKQIDGVLAPLNNRGGEVRQGMAALHHKDGWTALAFWDRSGDSRPRSNSVFFIKGTHDFEDTIKISKNVFPEIWGRFTFEIQKYEECEECKIMT